MKRKLELMKRCLVMALSAVMLITSVPFSVYAEENEEVVETPDDMQNETNESNDSVAPAEPAEQTMEDDSSKDSVDPAEVEADNDDSNVSDEAEETDELEKVSDNTGSYPYIFEDEKEMEPDVSVVKHEVITSTVPEGSATVTVSKTELVNGESVDITVNVCEGFEFSHLEICGLDLPDTKKDYSFTLPESFEGDSVTIVAFMTEILPDKNADEEETDEEETDEEEPGEEEPGEEEPEPDPFKVGITIPPLTERPVYEYPILLDPPKKEELIISFDAGGGKGTMEDMIFDPDADEFIFPVCEFTKKGYGFAFWTLNGKEATEDSVVRAFRDATRITLVAEWAKYKNGYNIYYEADNGKVYGPELAEPGTEITVATRPDKGYYLEYLEVDECESDFTFTMPEDDVYVYASFINYLTVSFDPGEGVGTMSPVTNVLQYDYFEVPKCEFTNPGYTFAYWSLDGEEVTEDVIDTYDENIVLVANWSRGDYEISSNAVNGKLVHPEFASPGDYVKVKAVPNTGYYLDYIEVNGFEEELEFEMPDEDVFIEGYFLKYLKVTFDANGGSGKMKSDNKVLQWDYYEIPDCEFEREGYEFVCWTYDGEEVEDEIETCDEDITLVAQWEKAIYPVNLEIYPDEDAGVVSISVDEASFGDEVSLEVLEVNDGYIFIGFQSDEVVITDGKFTMPGCEVNIVAEFEEIPTYYVSFDPGDGEGEMDDIEDVLEGTLLPIPKCRFKKPGYEFAYWTLDDEKVTKPILVDRDIYLIANWKKASPKNPSNPVIPIIHFEDFEDGNETSEDTSSNTNSSSQEVFQSKSKEPVYTIKFDANGGYGFMFNYVNLPYGTLCPMPDCFYLKPGYKFNGWTLNGVNLKDVKLFVATGDMTLKASWKKINVKSSNQILKDVSKNNKNKNVKLTYKDGTLDEVFSYKKGSTITLKDPMFTKKGYTFSSWMDEKGKTYKAGKTIKVNSNKTFEILWKKNKK